MGDRNNPITFGPEWLRSRLARERGAGNGANSQMAGATSLGSSGGGGGGAGATSPGATTSNASPNQTQTSKVKLAKLRYGREEMLALYDRSVEPPSELRAIDILYNGRVKAPAALLNTFEDEMRDNLRGGGTQPSGLTSADRYGIGRGAGRGLNPLDRGRTPRVPFVRTVPTARHVPPPPGSKRQGTNINWRQPQRGYDELEEWSSEGSPGSRSRPNTTANRWDRYWGDRPQERSQDRAQDKQPWNTNRRQWNENQDENLPEWAVDNAEACGGTFDSSGAFHGYSNDDNLPRHDSRNQESYPLARSHTTGYYTSLSKNHQSPDENYEESWPAEKAKKFDAIEVKFKKQMSAPEKMNSEIKLSSDEEISSKKNLPMAPEPPETTVSDNNLKEKGEFKQNFTKSKTFDSLLRSDVKMEEATDETGDFQSVMITPNNSLRQKHQNIGPMSNEGSKQSRPQSMSQSNNTPTKTVEASELTKQTTPEEKIIEDFYDIILEDKNHVSKMNPMSNNISNSGLKSGISTATSTMSQMPPLKMTMSNSGLQNVGLPLNSMSNMPSGPNPGLQSPRMLNALDIPMPGSILPGKGLQDLQVSRMQSLQSSGLQPSGLQSSGIPSSGIQSAGITNSALNASLGLPVAPNSASLGMPLQGVPSPILPNSNLQSAASVLPSFQNSNMQGLSSSNISGNSLFLGQNSNSTSIPMPPTADIPMPNSHSNQSNMFPLHGLQHTSPQSPFGSSLYESVMMQQQRPNQSPNILVDQWYYEDPEKMIQGPFSSKEMYTWYRAGFFTTSLMVRRACDTHMRPLGSYGPVVPFAQPDLMPPFPMPPSYEPRPQAPHESMINTQQAINLEGMNMSHNRNTQDNASLDPIQFGTVGMMRNTSFGQTPMHDSLWNAQNMMWMQQRNNSDLSMFFWDQPSAISVKSMLPEDITKDMKTEDQILAQLRAQTAQPNLQFLDEQSSPSAGKEGYVNVNTTPNLEELQKLLQRDGAALRETLESQDAKSKLEKTAKNDAASEEIVRTQSQTEAESKPNKQLKETDKSVKNKENNNTKNKNKKAKDDKKEDGSDHKQREEDSIKATKRSQESSPTKSKKEEKVNKKALENEKKEWLKDGFTIVKGADKSVKDKKKADEAKIAEDIERRRKEEEKLAGLEEEKKRKQTEALKKPQQQQESQQRQAAELVMKKAPWSMATNQAQAASNKDGLTLAEIQRLEKEKKLEQMKEQQQMMQIIAQQHQAAMVREQEMQAGLGWAKKKVNNSTVQGQSLAEIQAEARKNAASSAAAAAAAAAAAEDLMPMPVPVNNVPWGGSAQNGGGFWDTQPTPPKQSEKPEPVKKADPPKPVEQPKKSKKAASTLNIPAKKEITPAVEFESWCNSVLSPWSSKIDVPTFVGFLRDIESPYEVKDYVKCYLSETKESIDFARQFLERRSKLLRVGMVTPSDDLCSPAMAINPRTNSGSDYTEVKGKGKKTKKNKMLKVDARILGFSVTASEDRINVGDIDTV